MVSDHQANDTTEKLRHSFESPYFSEIAYDYKLSFNLHAKVFATQLLFRIMEEVNVYIQPILIPGRQVTALCLCLDETRAAVTVSVSDDFGMRYSTSRILYTILIITCSNVKVKKYMIYPAF